MNDEQLTFGIMLGVALLLGSGLIWVIGDDIDCTKVHNKNTCNALHDFSNHLPIGMVGGFLIIIGTVGFKIISDKGEKPKTEKVE